MILDVSFNHGGGRTRPAKKRPSPCNLDTTSACHMKSDACEPEEENLSWGGKPLDYGFSRPRRFCTFDISDKIPHIELVDHCLHLMMALPCRWCPAFLQGDKGGGA
jgi:hypothetical protein